MAQGIRALTGYLECEIDTRAKVAPALLDPMVAMGAVLVFVGVTFGFVALVSARYGVQGGVKEIG